MSRVMNYREIDPLEAIIVAADHADAWKEEHIPRRQYEGFVRKELSDFAKGKPVAPFDALVRCLRRVNWPEATTILDVGAAGGYYSEVLRIAGYDFQYTGLDFSPAFKALAEELYPGIAFELGDARALPYADDSFDVVMSGCCLLHILDYEQVIKETVRVASDYVIFSKTPVRDKTTYFEKEAYGCQMLEIHFGEKELWNLFLKYGLDPIKQADLYEYDGVMYSTYLLRKMSQGEREWERA